MESFVFRPIGVIHSPFKTPKGSPIQPSGATGVQGWIEVEDAYREGLRDLDGFSHVILLYHFHLASGYQLTVTPFLDNHPRGLFATRAPRRPNPIGLSVVRLTGIEGNILKIEDIDVVDTTPLLDVKPYVPDFDRREADRIGWMEGVSGNAGRIRADERFVK